MGGGVDGISNNVVADFYYQGVSMEEWDEWQKVYTYGTIVLWPPEPVRDIVNRLRHEYDPVSQSFCGAHITLTQPFLRQPSSNEWDKLSEVVSGFESFEIRYGPINTFLPYPCIWYEIHPLELVLAIRQALHATGMFNLDLPHIDDFIPHMTITEGQSDLKVTEDLFRKLRDQISGGRFICSEIALIVPDHHFHFGIQRRLPLRKWNTGMQK
jgi:2'-5' RNA ligase